MENKIIPTAEELINKIDNEFYEKNSYYLSISNPDLFAKTIAIEFAKLHVQQALKEAAEKACVDFFPHDEEHWTQKSIERQDILDFYDENTSDEDFAYEELKNRDGFTIELNEDSILNSYPLDKIK